jgi:hypothetical protein
MYDMWGRGLGERNEEGETAPLPMNRMKNEAGLPLPSFHTPLPRSSRKNPTRCVAKTSLGKI